MSDNPEQTMNPDEQDLTDQEIDKIPSPGSETSKQIFISAAAWETATTSWINDHVRNSPVSGFTEAWNHLMSALPHLRSALETELGKKE